MAQYWSRAICSYCLFHCIFQEREIFRCSCMICCHLPSQFSVIFLVISVFLAKVPVEYYQSVYVLKLCIAIETKLKMSLPFTISSDITIRQRFMNFRIASILFMTNRTFAVRYRRIATCPIFLFFFPVLSFDVSHNLQLRPRVTPFFFLYRFAWCKIRALWVHKNRNLCVPLCK